MQRRSKVAALSLPFVIACCAVNDANLEAVTTAPPDEERLLWAEGGSGTFAGSDSCRECHGRLHAYWLTTAHAASMESLSATGEEHDPSCLRCHATGYGSRDGYDGADPAPGLASVSCEACHGPSADHARSAYPGFVPTAGAAECTGCEVSRVCRRCHTRRRSPGFVLSRGLAAVGCSFAPGALSGGRK